MACAYPWPVKVFLSWSGERSKYVAAALREWLPSAINEVQPFMSAEIDAGARWQSEVSSELESTDFGIICVTSENQDKPWINFEAGALAKSVTSSRVIPLAINLTPAEIKNPLGQFQTQPLTREGMLRVLLSLSLGAQRPMSQGFVEKSLAKWWPDLDSEIKEVQKRLDQGVSLEKPPRSDRDLLEDILTSVRSLVRKERSSQSIFSPKYSELDQIIGILGPMPGKILFSINPGGSIALTLPVEPNVKAHNRLVQLARENNWELTIEIDPSLLWQPKGLEPDTAPSKQGETNDE